METQIYTDGGCHGNPGPGAWAYVLRLEDETIEDSGAEPQTTNNRMELTAVIRALERIDPIHHGTPVVHTDSQYVKNGITSWIHNWRRNGWRTAGKKPVKNRDLWETLYNLSVSCSPLWKWVKGHAGDPDNERCDALVQAAIATIE